MKSPMKRVPPVIKQQKRVAAPQPPQVPLPPRKKSMETAPAMQIARGSAPQGTTPMLTADAISRIVASRPGALRNMFIMSEVIGKPVAFKST